jgi:hypothetical protein
MEKYQNQYRIPSTRAVWWNYAAEAAYFITICTHERECFFGNIIEGEMISSEIGTIVLQEWTNTFDMRPDMNIQSGEFVVMPNHFHAIVIIGENEYNRQITQGNTFSPQSKNLAAIVRGFKSAVTHHARFIRPAFAWQTRFYDRIIRDNSEYQRIAEYILNNPSKWHDDQFYIK